MSSRPLWLSTLVLTFAAGAHAGTLTNATWLQIVDGFVTGVPMTRTFSQLGASGTSTATSISVSLVHPFVATTVFVPKTPNDAIDYAVQVTQGGAQAITATAGMGNGTPGIPGTLVLMTAGHIGMGVDQSMFSVGVGTVVQVPLGHGKATQFMNTFFFGGATNFITVDFFAWTPGTLVFTGLTSVFAPLPNVTAMGSFALTPNGAGTVTLVSPSKVSIDGPYGQRRKVSITTLTLSFVPEPGALLLLGASGLALALAGRRRPR